MSIRGTSLAGIGGRSSIRQGTGDALVYLPVKILSMAGTWGYKERVWEETF
jgi:hypothetical protein